MMMEEPYPPGKGGIKGIYSFPLFSTSPSLASTPTYQECLDAVASRGAYLLTPPNTPNLGKNSELVIENFKAGLTHKLNLLLSRHESRRHSYGNAADEWSLGHTPPELSEKHAAELERVCDLVGGPSPPSDCSDSENPETKAILERRKEVAGIWNKPRVDHRPEQHTAGCLPAPSSSDPKSPCTDSPVSVSSNRRSPEEIMMVQGKKRRRSDETDAEIEVPAKRRHITRSHNVHLRRGGG
ncbi:hypothetical protein F4779DRAFT_579196 [Xylariaceae sp. FL0662B]|nr:hypothetical protein F4779DRAFT_579196 [Xylariaceae sp. FL0662B]